MFKLLMPLIGGWVSRIVGGGFPSTWIPIPAQWIYAIPYFFIFNDLKLSLLSYVITGVTKRFGHGQYIGLGYSARQPKENDEKLDFIVKFFFGEDNGGNYWRCAFGLAVTGLIMTIPLGCMYSFINPLYGIILGVSGVTKTIAYMIGWKIYDKLNISPTAIGEFLTGVFGWGILLLFI